MINDNFCPVCESSISEWKRKIIDNQEYKIDLCNDCGYAFINPRPTQEFISKYYETFNISDEVIQTEIKVDKYSYSDIDAKQIVQNISKFTNNINGLNFLDVGSGHGLISRAALNSDFNVTALEMSNIERHIAYRHND
jgi:2-polyprenyl-3-methyl-5-hydroxy-6-metoxy-1,4-benzoquinol methylase